MYRPIRNRFVVGSFRKALVDGCCIRIIEI